MKASSICYLRKAKDPLAAFMFPFNSGGRKSVTLDGQYPAREEQRKPHCQPQRTILMAVEPWPTIGRGRTQGSERLLYFPKITQLLSYKAGNWVQVCPVSKLIPLNHIRMSRHKFSHHYNVVLLPSFKKLGTNKTSTGYLLCGFH